MNLSAALPIEQTWLAHAIGLSGSRELVSMQAATGAVQAVGTDHHPMLIWIQDMSSIKAGGWALGGIRKPWPISWATCTGT